MLTSATLTPQNKDVDECHGELRQLCIAVLNARAGLRQRAASLLPSGPAVSSAPMPTALMPGACADAWPYHSFLCGAAQQIGLSRTAAFAHVRR